MLPVDSGAASTFGDVDGVAAAIRSGGGRLSAPCRIVLRALFAAEFPVSATQIADSVGGGLLELEVSSIYRNLQRLEELGVVRRVHVGPGARLYALQDGRQREYLACHDCGGLEAVDPTRLHGVRAEIRDAFGYHAEFTDFALIGVCPQCASQAESPSTESPSAGI